MHPRLFTTPFFTLHTFGVLLAIAFLAAMWWIVREAKRVGLNHDRVISLGMWAIGGGILGAKLLMVIRTLPEYLSNPSGLWSLSFLESAGDFYGGFLGALLAVSIYFWRHPELPVWRTADLCGPAIALGQAIGRIGCFMAGDDYGRAASVPWAVTFTDPDAASIGGAPLGVPLHPVQLYESLFCFMLFLFLVWLRRRKSFDGQIILAYALLYAILRFLIEYFRGDADRGFVMNGLFSTSQFIAIPLGLISLALLIYRFRVQKVSIRSDSTAPSMSP
jgi:phosphatidylglycerol:prolipoprotein diacylglycerol transferase